MFSIQNDQGRFLLKKDDQIVHFVGSTAISSVVYEVYELPYGEEMPVTDSEAYDILQRAIEQVDENAEFTRAIISYLTHLIPSRPGHN
jgi:hypothetical protein